MQTRDVQPSDAKWVSDLIRERWAGLFVVTKGRKHDTRRIPGIVACDEARPVGLLLFSDDGPEIEIVTLDALQQRKGVGRLLLHAISRYAAQRGVHRLWVITTNDNLPAVAFYTACGFRLVAVHLDAVTKARGLKPEIPLTNAGGITIRDELEFEMNVPNRTAEPPRTSVTP